MTIKKDLYKLQYNSFTIFIYLSYFLIIISAIGLSTAAPKFLNTLDYFVRIYICLFLIWRFHPYKEKYEFTDLDRRISFSAGLFILTTTFINTYITNAKTYTGNLINKLKNTTNTNINTNTNNN
jgi:hypothetical protein